MRRFWCSIFLSTELKKFVPGHQVAVSIRLILKKNTALQMQIVEMAVIVHHYSDNPQDTRVWDRFVTDVRPNIYKNPPVDRQIDMGYTATPLIDVSDDDFEAFHNHTASVFLLAAAKWINPSGSDGRLGRCVYLRPGDILPTGRILITTESHWLTCTATRISEDGVAGLISHPTSALQTMRRRCRLLSALQDLWVSIYIHFGPRMDVISAERPQRRHTR
jgi:hypothetical protein